jgi:hypothetical protein
MLLNSGPFCASQQTHCTRFGCNAASCSADPATLIYLVRGWGSRCADKTTLCNWVEVHNGGLSDVESMSKVDPTAD